MYAIDGLHLLQSVPFAHLQNLQGVQNLLQRTKYYLDSDSWQYKATCNVEGWRLSYTRTVNGEDSIPNENESVTLTIRGSLHVWHHGHNAGNFTFEETSKAATRLAERLNLDPAITKVTSAEIGTNCQLNDTADIYLAHLVAVESKPFERDYNGMLTAKRSKYDVKVYDKGKQMRTVHPEVKDLGYNVLRVEVKFQAALLRLSEGMPLRLIDLMDARKIETIGKRLRPKIERCIWFAPLDIIDPLPASQFVNAKAGLGERERWNTYALKDRKRIKRQRKKIEAAHATYTPSVEVLKAIDAPNIEIGPMSRFAPYDKGEERDIAFPTQWTRHAVLEWFSIDPTRPTPAMIERHANRQCVVCGRKLKGKAETTCQRPASCRNAKSNPVHDVCRAIAKELNEKPHLAVILTRKTIQQRINKRLAQSHIRYRQPLPQTAKVGESLF